MRFLTPLLFAVATLVPMIGVGCGSSDSSPSTSSASEVKCSTNGECAKVAGKTLCDVGKKVCVAGPRGGAIGHGDGSPSSVELVDLYSTGLATKPVDLAFHNERQDELWVVGYQSSSVYIGFGIGGDSPSWKYFRDPAAKHFMYKPPAIAMGVNNTWATCGNNDNTQNASSYPGMDGAGADFMGPALFSADLAIFSKVTPTGLGSHLDMLHNTSFCRGIAHEKNNRYWVFNSQDASLDQYDFNVDHGPGNDDHSDGEIYRYVKGQVKGAADETPSHLVFDREKGFVYVADTGNARVARLDPSKATKARNLPRSNEPLKGSGIMEGATLEDVVAPGVLKAPSGIELRDQLLYVTDAQTSRFHVFDLDGKEVRKLDTGLEPGSLAGFAFGPDGKVYFTDRVKNRVMRIDPK